MARSKYFSESKRNKDKKIIPSTSALAGDYTNATDIAKKVNDLINLINMQMISSGEDLLGYFNSASVDSVPDSLVDDGNAYDRVQDYIVPQEYMVPRQNDEAPKLQSEASILIARIKDLIGKNREQLSQVMPYYGYIKASENDVFYPRVIRYSNGEAYYDIKLTGLPENERMSSVKINIRNVQ